jgi:hypothetical protein
MYEDMYRGCRLVVDRLSAASDKVKRSETDHLYALVDGLAVHTILQPKLMTAQRALTIVEHYLHAIHFPPKASRR